MTERYRTIVADPPWDYREGFATMPDRPRAAARAAGAATTTASIINRALPYPSMSLPEIEALPVRDMAHADGCNLFLWTTSRYLHDAFHVAAAWGAKYRQVAVWSKPAGSRPQWASNVVEIPRPAGHSQKPEAFLDLVEQVSPGPYLELFARRQRLGWDTWGNEALEHVNMEGVA